MQWPLIGQLLLGVFHHMHIHSVVFPSFCLSLFLVLLFINWISKFYISFFLMLIFFFYRPPGLYFFITKMCTIYTVHVLHLTAVHFSSLLVKYQKQKCQIFLPPVVTSESHIVAPLPLLGTLTHGTVWVKHAINIH